MERNPQKSINGETPRVANRFLLRQIENILYEHSGIEEVAVVCNASEDGKERLIAFIVPRFSELTEEKIIDFLQQKNELEPESLPQVVKFVSRIPKSPSGKVLKLRLFEEACISVD